MKSLKIFSAALAVSAVVCAGAASAADMAVKAMPYAAPAPVFSWTGCYVGVHGGAGVLHDQGFHKFSSLLTDTVWAVSPAARSAATTRPACSFSVSRVKVSGPG